MQFFKTFLASLLGTFLALLILIIVLIAAAVSSSSEPEPYIRSNTVLKINLQGDIPMRTPDDPLQELLNPGAGSKVSVESLRNNLRKAASDENIKGVWIESNMVSAPWANLQSVREYLQEYKESGKFLYVSTDDIGFNEKAYYLATAADSIFSPPETNFQFSGFVAQLTFYRDMLDKIGVEPEIFRVGEYKSAVEPYLRNSSSPESREQLNAILSTFSSTFIEAVSERTGKSSDEIDDMLNTPPVDRLQFALDNGLIDAFAFSDEVESIIKQKIELDEDDDLRTVNFGRYSRVSDSRAGLDVPDTSDKIAVIYTSGMILPDLPDSPFGTSSAITSSKVKNQLDDATSDENVKAIVIHINSPGGSATTSDLLWHHIKQASNKVPVVASMGNVAASGGYYMAAGADTIMAAENTITGSIGIFNLMFNARELTSDKLGINYETLKTHEYADLFDLSRPLTNAERSVIQQNIESGYESFLERVAEARNMTRDEVDAVARGRVYTGQAAKDAGIVDLVGDLDDALLVAAEMARIEKFRVDTYPKRKDLFESLFGSANTQLKSLMFGWIPHETRSEMNDLHSIMQQPAGQNWMLLPVKFDTN